MPNKTNKPCNTIGCPNLTQGPYCDKCSTPKEDRPTTAQRGYGHKWQVARKRFLSMPHNVFCRHHKKRGELVMAKVVDHIIPHRGDDRLMWDDDNWQPLCVRCHNAKTRSERHG